MLPQIGDSSLLFLVGLTWIIYLFSDEFQPFRAFLYHGAVEAGLVADMALSGIDGDFQQKAILVAIDEYLMYFLDMTAFFALLPQLLSRPAEIGSITALYCFIKGLAVHISDHEDLSGICVLSYSSDESVLVEFGREICTFFDSLVRCHLPAS